MLRAHPRLAAIPRVPLLAGPTPIEEASALARGIGLASLAIKRDDLTHERYGGGKVRKLETLLAQAEASGAERLMTFGSVGSHHALATAVHGIARGFEVELLLLPEPPSESVRSTLARTLATGAEAHLVGSMAAALQRSRHARETTFVVPVGGTSAIANVGFVAAGFEIADAVAQGAIEKPERIYIALGTTGSAAGLALASRQPASRKWR
jgi:D-cysteine desulfhydrase